MTTVSFSSFVGRPYSPNGEIGLPIKIINYKSMKKLTRKQLQAVEYLAYDMDELSNKPRRLFSSLKEFSNQFVEEEQLPDVIKRINEFERFYYLFINMPDIARDVFSERMATDRELVKDGEEENYKYNQGVEDATELYCTKMINNLIKYYK